MSSRRSGVPTRAFLDPSLQNLAKDLERRCARTGDYERGAVSPRTTQEHGAGLSRTHFSAQSVVRNLAHECEKNARVGDDSSDDDAYHDTTLLEANQRLMNSYYSERGLRPHYHTRPAATALAQSSTTSAYDLHRRLEKGESPRPTPQQGLPNLRGANSFSASATKSQQSKKSATLGQVVGFNTLSDYIASCQSTRSNSRSPIGHEFKFNKKNHAESKEMEHTKDARSLLGSPSLSSRSERCASKVSSHSYRASDPSLESYDKTFEEIPQRKSSHSKISTFFNFIHPKGKKKRAQDAERKDSNCSLENDSNECYSENQLREGRKNTKIDLFKNFFGTRSSVVAKDSDTDVNAVLSGGVNRDVEECADAMTNMALDQERCGEASEKSLHCDREEVSQRSLSPNILRLENDSQNLDAFSAQSPSLRQNDEVTLESQGQSPSKTPPNQSLIRQESSRKMLVAQRKYPLPRKEVCLEVYHCDTVSLPSAGTRRGGDSDAESSVSSRYCLDIVESHGDQSRESSPETRRINREDSGIQPGTRAWEWVRSENTQSRSPVKKIGNDPLEKTPVFAFPDDTFSSTKQLASSGSIKGVKELQRFRQPRNSGNLLPGKCENKMCNYQRDRESNAPIHRASPTPCYGSQVKEIPALTLKYCIPGGSVEGSPTLDRWSVADAVSKMPTCESWRSSPRSNNRMSTPAKEAPFCPPTEVPCEYDGNWRSMARSARYETGSNVLYKDRNQFFQTTMPLSSCPSVVSRSETESPKRLGTSPRENMCYKRTEMQSGRTGLAEELVTMNDEVPKYSRFAPWYRDWLASRKSKTKSIAASPSKTLTPEMLEQIRRMVALPPEVQEKLRTDERRARRRRR